MPAEGLGTGSHRNGGHVLFLNRRDCANPEGVARRSTSRPSPVRWWPAEPRSPCGLGTFRAPCRRARPRRAGRAPRIEARHGAAVVVGASARAAGTSRCRRRCAERPSLRLASGGFDPDSRPCAPRPSGAVARGLRARALADRMGAGVAAGPRVYRGCQYVTVSEATRVELASLGIDPELIEVVRNGYSRPAPTSWPIPPSPDGAGPGPSRPPQAGRARSRGGGVPSRDPGLRVRVVGDGWWHDRIRQRVRRAGPGRHGRAGRVRRRCHQARRAGRAWVLAMPSLRRAGASRSPRRRRTAFQRWDTARLAVSPRRSTTGSAAWSCQEVCRSSPPRCVASSPTRTCAGSSRQARPTGPTRCPGSARPRHSPTSCHESPDERSGRGRSRRRPSSPPSRQPATPRNNERSSGGPFRLHSAGQLSYVT